MQLEAAVRIAVVPEQQIAEPEAAQTAAPLEVQIAEPEAQTAPLAVPDTAVAVPGTEAVAVQPDTAEVAAAEASEESAVPSRYTASTDGP